MKKIFSIISLLCATFFVASCTSDVEVAEQGEGYLKLQLETIVSTFTRADVPAGYNAKKLYVAIQDENGLVAKDVAGVSLETDDWDNSETLKGKIIKLAEGTYTIVAHSANWDGSNSAFDAPYYAGSATTTIKRNTLNTASVTCTLANVKVTVNFDDNFKKYFESAKAEVTSAMTGVTARTFVMGQTTGSAYFPVADLSLKVTVNNDATKTQTNEVKDVKARDHIIVNYSVGDPVGNQGKITVYTDDATQTYTYNILIPRKNLTNVEARNVTPWSTFAELSGKASLEKNDFNNVILQWKKQADSDWTTVANDALTIDKGNVSYKLKGLAPSTAYSYRFVYDNGTDEAINSNEVNFTTEAQTTLYNGGFENWYTDPNNSKIAICGSASDGKYWNSSNAGAATFIGSVTTQDTGFKHGGNSSAKLATKYAVVKLAAASLFTGDFIGLIGTKGAKLDWGVPFTSRPTALKGYYSYSPGSLNRGTQPSGAPSEGSNDECQIFCALVTEQFHVANAEASGYEMTTEIDWQNDPRVIAYGQMTQNTSSNGAWQELNIPLEYHSLTKKPTHLIIVCSASKYGDYFYGSDSSVLNLDDFELVYGDEPSVK